MSRAQGVRLSVLQVRASFPSPNFLVVAARSSALLYLETRIARTIPVKATMPNPGCVQEGRSSGRGRGGEGRGETRAVVGRLKSGDRRE